MEQSIFCAMSTADKRWVIEAAWASLDNPAELPVPDWHGEVLAQRRERLQGGQASVSSWADAKKRFDEFGNVD